MTWIVYEAVNKINGKRYIGVTGRRLIQRRRKHFANVAAGGCQCPRFYAAIRKYGIKEFRWKVLAKFALRDMAYHHEFVLVKDVRPEYNSAPGGKLNPVMAAWNRMGVLCLEDGKLFASATEAALHYGCVSSEVTKAARGKGLVFGRHFTISTTPMSFLERMSTIKQIDETRAKLRRRVEKRVSYNELIAEGRDKNGRRATGPMKLSRAVICLDDGKVFPSISATAESYDIAKSSLIELCNGRNGRQSVGGKHFAFIEDIGQRWVA